MAPAGTSHSRPKVRVRRPAFAPAATQAGPLQPPSPPEHLQTDYPPLGTVALRVDVETPSFSQPRPMLGAEFNFEHGLLSCPEFRGLFRSEILDPFKPAIARVNTGVLPAAPADLLASALGPSVYVSVLSSAPYADSWRFFHRLNRAGVKIILGVLGDPAQFTEDGTLLGVLSPAHYDDYVEYVATRSISWSASRTSTSGPRRSRMNPMAAMATRAAWHTTRHGWRRAWPPTE